MSELWMMCLVVCPLVFLAGFVDSVAGGGGLATHEGCDPEFREAMTEIAKQVWESEEFSGWVESALLNNFQKYGDEAVDFYATAREKAMDAYALLLEG